MHTTADHDTAQALSHTIAQAVRRATAKPPGLTARDIVRLQSDRVAERNSSRMHRIDAGVNVFCAVLLGVAGALVAAHWWAGA